MLLLLLLLSSMMMMMMMMMIMLLLITVIHVIPGLGSTYAETFENSGLFRDGEVPKDYLTMDISTDGSSKLPVKKQGKS
jgi:hypothetical protein